MNHCMNCSDGVVALLAGERGQRVDLLADALLLRERERHRAHHVVEVDLRGGDAGDHGPLVGVDQVLDHHHRVVALFERLAVEEARQLGQRLGVVVDGDGHVLLVRGVLVPDLIVEPGDEGVGWHGRERYRERGCARRATS